MSGNLTLAFGFGTRKQGKVVHHSKFEQNITPRAPRRTPHRSGHKPEKLPPPEKKQYTNGKFICAATRNLIAFLLHHCLKSVHSININIKVKEPHCYITAKFAPKAVSLTLNLKLYVAFCLHGDPPHSKTKTQSASIMRQHSQNRILCFTHTFYNIYLYRSVP